MKPQRLNGTIELRDAGEGPPKISGYASVFYRSGDPSTEFRLWDGAVERIMPTAFDNVENHDVRALFNHDPNMVLGRKKSGTLSLSVDDHGLRYEVEPNGSRTYRDVAEMVSRGDVDGSSFQFVIKRETWIDEEDGREVREIHEVELLDVGPVTFPAYSGSSSQAASARDSHSVWRRARDMRDDEKKRREATLRALRLKLIDFRRRP